MLSLYNTLSTLLLALSAINQGTELTTDLIEQVKNLLQAIQEKFFHAHQQQATRNPHDPLQPVRVHLMDQIDEHLSVHNAADQQQLLADLVYHLEQRRAAIIAPETRKEDDES